MAHLFIVLRFVIIRSSLLLGLGKFLQCLLRPWGFGFVALRVRDNDQAIEQVIISEQRELFYAKSRLNNQAKQVLNHTSGDLWRLIKYVNARVIVPNNFIITSDNEIIFRMMSTDIQCRYRFDKPHNHRIGKNKLIVTYRLCDMIIEQGVLLSANYSYNFYHFVYEILPRFMDIEKYVPSHIPLIIDSDMTRYEQFSQMLNIFNKSNREIIVVKADCMVLVKELYMPEIRNFIPPNFTDMSTIEAYDNRFDLRAIDFLRQVMLSTKSDDQTPKRVFLHRNSSYRIFNQDEVFEAIASLGFVKVSTETMSATQQATLFNNAEIIVSGSGAALTNIVYCKEGANIFVITAVFEENMTVFSSIAKIVGADMCYITQNNTKIKKATDVHDDFYIEPAIIVESIKNVI